MNGHLIKKIHLDSLKMPSTTLARDLEIAAALLRALDRAAKR